MAQWVTVWRAAQLVGVPRGVLQRQVQAGEIPLADGLVSTDTLLQLYPHTELESTGLLERVLHIRDDSFGKRLRERLLPSQEVLAQRVFAQGQELADAHRLLQRYHALILTLRQHLSDGAGDNPQFAALLHQLNDGLAHTLATEPVGKLDVMDDVLKMVSAQVTLRPSGHQFSVEGHDTLLQAGLRAGLKLNYGCGNGSCGMCKVRVIDGQVTRTQHTDYGLSETEKAQGYVLACAHTAASSELTMETLEANGPSDIPSQHIVTTVRGLRALGPDTRLVHLQTPRSHRLRFLAGQSATLGLALGEGVRDTLPIASCPCDDRNLHFFVARDASNPLACQVFDGMKVGDAVNLWGPVGDFVLSDGQRPLVFVACDLGVSPIKSLIEHALSLDASPSISLFWLATRADGHFMANQCRAWSEALDLFEYALFNSPTVNDGVAPVVKAIRADLFDIDCDFYLAGPEFFVTAVQRELCMAGVAQAQIFGEILA